jgi:outer membrane protein TolC
MLALGQAAGEPQGRLTIKDAIDLGLKQHPAVQEFQERVASAQAQIGVARSAFFPQVTFSGNYYYGDAFPTISRGGVSFGSPSSVSSAAGGVRTDYYIYRFSASQLIYDFGKTSGQLAGSQATYKQSAEDLAGTRQKVALDVRTAYYGYLAARRAVEVEKENVRQNEELLKQATGFYQVGLRAKIDVTKAEANLYDAQAALIRARNLVDVARVSLLTALGLKTWPFDSVEDTLEVKPTKLSLPDLLAQALRQRPEILRNRYQQQGNEAAVQVARAGYFPAFTSNAAYGWQGPQYPLQDNWWVGVAVSFPLFEGLNTLYSVRSAKAQLRASQANAEVLSQDVTKEVEQSYYDLQSAWEVIRATTKAREAAAENLRLAQGRYKAGVGNIIEVTDAQVQFARSDLNYVRALYDYRIVEARLDKAVGRPF